MIAENIVKELGALDSDTVVVCRSEDDDGWDNIQRIEKDGRGGAAIVFGGGSPFTDDNSDEEVREDVRLMNEALVVMKVAGIFVFGWIIGFILGLCF